MSLAVVTPREEIEFQIESHIGHVWEVIKQEVAKLAPANLAKIGFGAFTLESIGVVLLNLLPDLPRANFTEPKARRESRGTRLGGQVPIILVAFNS